MIFTFKEYAEAAGNLLSCVVQEIYGISRHEVKMKIMKETR